MLSNKSYSFYCDDLNQVKYDLLYNKANDLLEFRNQISLEISNNPLNFIDKSKFDYINYFRKQIPSCNNQDISNSITEVFVSYENKRNKFISNVTTKIQSKISKTYYKRNTNKFNKGDLKTYKIEFKSTNLTKVVTYLTKYYNDSLIEYLTNKQDKNELNNLVLFYYNKYGNRLIDLAKNKQNRVLNNTFKFPIVFTSLSFKSCTEQKKNIINKNPIMGSKYNAYISLSGQKIKGGKLDIPVKYSRKHHGNLADYYKLPNSKNQIVYSYTIVFERKQKIRVVLSVERENIDIVTNKTDYYGIDVNVKHNLFCDKEYNTIDYDRNIFNDYIKYLKRMDYKSKLNRKDKIVKDKWVIRIKDMLTRKSSDLVKQTIFNGFNHIVMEDLKCMGKSYTTNEELHGFKYSRLNKLLNLSNIKNIVSGIANKKGIQITFVQPHYTSQCCDKCGNIDKGNRNTQEEFKCKVCKHSLNADAHAASMIEDRLKLDVLRQSLLVNSNGVYSPRKLNKFSIKNILAECYDNNNTICII